MNSYLIDDVMQFIVVVSFHFCTVFSLVFLVLFLTFVSLLLKVTKNHFTICKYVDFMVVQWSM